MYFVHKNAHIQGQRPKSMTNIASNISYSAPIYPALISIDCRAPIAMLWWLIMECYHKLLTAHPCGSERGKDLNIQMDRVGGGGVGGNRGAGVCMIWMATLRRGCPDLGWCATFLVWLCVTVVKLLTIPHVQHIHYLDCWQNGKDCVF